MGVGIDAVSHLDFASPATGLCRIGTLGGNRLTGDAIQRLPPSRHSCRNAAPTGSGLPAPQHKQQPRLTSTSIRHCVYKPRSMVVFACRFNPSSMLSGSTTCILGGSTSNRSMAYQFGPNASSSVGACRNTDTVFPRNPRLTATWEMVIGCSKACSST